MILAIDDMAAFQHKIVIGLRASSSRRGENCCEGVVNQLPAVRIASTEDVGHLSMIEPFCSPVQALMRP